MNVITTDVFELMKKYCSGCEIISDCPMSLSGLRGLLLCDDFRRRYGK